MSALGSALAGRAAFCAAALLLIVAACPGTLRAEMPARSTTLPAARPSPAVQPLRLPAPTISSVEPRDCVRIGERVTLKGANFGKPKPAEYSLGVLKPDGDIFPVTELSWTATSIEFLLPSGAGVRGGRQFTAVIVKRGSLVASIQLKACPALPPPRVTTGLTSPPNPQSRFVAAKVPFHRASVVGDSTPQEGEGPEITSISASPPSPADCVSVKASVTAHGANLGTTKQASELALGIQVDGGPSWIPIDEDDWSPTSITFKVPKAVAGASWFALGLEYRGVFYPQLYLAICGASPSFDYPGGDYGQSGDGEYQGDYPAGGGASPPSARKLGPGTSDIQIEPTPPQDGPPGQAEPPPQPVVGGKALAMRMLAKRGLRKVNAECDILEPHCPCCRKDDTVCFEKERDSDDGTSVWAVSVRAGAKGPDGRSAYGARDAEDDVEAVTGLQCEPETGGAGASAGDIVLICR